MTKWQDVYFPPGKCARASERGCALNIYFLPVKLNNYYYITVQLRVSEKGGSAPARDPPVQRLASALSFSPLHWRLDPRTRSGTLALPRSQSASAGRRRVGQQPSFAQHRLRRIRRSTLSPCVFSTRSIVEPFIWVIVSLSSSGTGWRCVPVR